jgi:excinuclease ABC subunit A
MHRMALTHISVRGAREHNLKGVDIDLPRDTLIVITGLSGGQIQPRLRHHLCRRAAALRGALSAYARQFLEMMQKPDVEHIDGLSPAISIEQKTTSRNPRSTVATVTEIYDYMRLLWARVGIPYSPATGLPIAAQTVSQMVDRVMALPEGTRLYAARPGGARAQGRIPQGAGRMAEGRLPACGSTGRPIRSKKPPRSTRSIKHDIEVVVDRIAVRDGLDTRLAESFEQALKLAEGLAYVDLAEAWCRGVKRRRSLSRKAAAEPARKSGMKGAGMPPNRIVFSEKFACPVSGFTIEEIEPRLFSFNAPQGACPACDGIGEKLLFDPQLVVPNEALSLKKGAVVPWAKSNPPSPYYMQVLASLARNSASASTPRGRTCPASSSADHPPRHGRQAGAADLQGRPQEYTSRSRSRA